MHYACIPQSNKARSRAATPRRRHQTRPTKKEPKKEEPQNQKKKQKGLGANPGHETIPEFTLPLRQDLLLGHLGPFRGSQMVVRYVAIAPLSGSALHIFKLHFCKCIRPLPGIVAANRTWQHFLCGSVACMEFADSNSLS